MCSTIPHVLLMHEFDAMYGWKLAALLDADIPILVYNGDKDYMCNWRGGLRWTNALYWYGNIKYREAPYLAWFSDDGERVGNFKNYGPLSFAQVFEAGHMVPRDQPKAAYQLLREFLKHGKIGVNPWPNQDRNQPYVPFDEPEKNVLPESEKKPVVVPDKKPVEPEEEPVAVPDKKPVEPVKKPD